METFELLYSETHEWLGVVEGQDYGQIAYVGVSSFAIKQLTDVVYLALPAVGDKLTKDQSFGEIESVKAVSDLIAPVDGEVIQINQSAIDDPASLSDNDDPWLIKIKIDSPDITHLMSKKDYEEHNKNDS